MGKAEGSVAREEWHGHVTALSVAPEFRRLGLAAKLMEMLEEISERYVIILTAGNVPYKRNIVLADLYFRDVSGKGLSLLTCLFASPIKWQ